MDPVQKMWRYLNDNTRASLGSTLITLMDEYLVGKKITRTIPGIYEYRCHLCKGSIYNNVFFFLKFYRCPSCIVITFSLVQICSKKLCDVNIFNLDWIIKFFPFIFLVDCRRVLSHSLPSSHPPSPPQKINKGRVVSFLRFGTYTPYSKMAAILVFFCLIANWPFWPRSS